MGGVFVKQVASTARREQARRPPPPFTTSTMQQEASAKLGLSPSRTMATAQQLYEGPEEAGGALPPTPNALSLVQLLVLVLSVALWLAQSAVCDGLPRLGMPRAPQCLSNARSRLCGGLNQALHVWTFSTAYSRQRTCAVRPLSTDCNSQSSVQERG